MISKKVSDLIGIPQYYVDEYNLTSVVNFWCIFERILQIVRPSGICEIGAERGMTTARLASYCRAERTELFVVDPAGVDQVESDQFIHVFAEKSVAFFERKMPIDFYIIDGDHNYETVSAELQFCVRNHLPNHPLFIVMHDVSWPWAYRDMYYDPASLISPLEHEWDAALVLENEDFAPRGFPSGGVYAIVDAMARQYGGEHNGVRRAVEDFLASSESDWRFWSIPTLFGFGCLWQADWITADQNHQLEKLFTGLEPIRSLLAILEVNRLRLLQGLDEYRELATASERENARLGRERQELYDVAEARLAELQRLGRERQELYDVAEARLAELQRLGWVRHLFQWLRAPRRQNNRKR
jgi:hypothetical protein